MTPYKFIEPTLTTTNKSALAREIGISPQQLHHWLACIKEDQYRWHWFVRTVDALGLDIRDWHKANVK